MSGVIVLISGVVWSWRRTRAPPWRSRPRWIFCWIGTMAHTQIPTSANRRTACNGLLSLFHITVLYRADRRRPERIALEQNRPTGGEGENPRIVAWGANSVKRRCGRPGYMGDHGL